MSYLLVNVFHSCSSVSSIANLPMSNRDDHFQRKKRRKMKNVNKKGNEVEEYFQPSWNKKLNWENNFPKMIENVFEHVQLDLCREGLFIFNSFLWIGCKNFVVFARTFHIWRWRRLVESNRSNAKRCVFRVSVGHFYSIIEFIYKGII